MPRVLPGAGLVSHILILLELSCCQPNKYYTFKMDECADFVFCGGAESFFMKFCGVSYIAPETGVGPDDDGDDPEDAPEWTPPK